MQEQILSTLYAKVKIRHLCEVIAKFMNDVGDFLAESVLRQTTSW
jgi:hypothetical protein